MWKKGNPKEDGWYMVAVHDEAKGKVRTLRCFWRNEPKKVYYKKDGKTKFRYKGTKGWSPNNLRGRKVIAWDYMSALDNLEEELKKNEKALL